jgi:hypothetical protein
MIRSFAGHQEQVMGVCWSPDGKSLASGSWDSTLLVWPRSGLTSPLPAKLDKDTLEILWRQLADPNPARADPAIWRLHAAPSSSIPFLQKVRPTVQPADPKLVQRLLQQLDAETFAVRQRAEEDLAKLEEGAANALRAFLQSKPSPEAARRAKRLLAAAEAAIDAPESLRIQRTVMVLEQIGTLEAQKVLQLWSRGVASALLTREAKAAIVRLQHRNWVR